MVNVESLRTVYNFFFKTGKMFLFFEKFNEVKRNFFIFT